MAKPDVLARSRHAKAITLYNAGQLVEADAVYARICQTAPADVRAWTMRALIQRRLCQWQASEDYSRRALALDPRCAEAYKVLGQVRHCQGRMDEAAATYRQALALAPGEAQTHYLLANALRESGALHEAARSYREAIRLAPDYLAALSNLGALLLTLGEAAEAAVLLNRALALAPDSHQVLCNLGHALLRDGRPDEALVRYRRALALCPDSPDVAAAAAAVLEKNGALDDARRILDGWLGDLPPPLRLVAARLARRDKRYEEAISQLEAALAEPVSPELAGDAHMLLGQLYDKQGKADLAYPHLLEGNRLTSLAIRDCLDNGNRYIERIARLRRYLTAALSGAATAGEGASPIFLLGFPRSGTTLLEQILDSHPALLGLEEKATVSPVVEAFERMSDGSPDALARLDDVQVESLRQLYFAELAKHVPPDSQRQVVDKLPLNTVNTHLIWRLFPNARFILAIRHPCDACFSCFMQNFTINEAMASFFTLERTAQVYNAVMRTWVEAESLLPLRYHRIRYEDLVDDFEGQTRALLDFLGVGWSEAVRGHVEHAARRGTINTPSYHQVTQPIYRDARFRWKRYAMHFGDALPWLRLYIDYFGYGEALDMEASSASISQ